MRFLAGLMSGGLLMAGCTSPRESPAASSRLSLAPCVVAGIEARCGSLTVPENRKTPGGRTIRLNMVVLPARGQKPAPDPIFYLAGGPGQGATSLAPTGIVDLSLRDDRDLVFVDQRGTGGSNALDCELPGSPADQAGIREGDIITKVNDQTIDTDNPLDATLSLFAPGDTVTVTILRDGQTTTVQVTLGTRPAS